MKRLTTALALGTLLRFRRTPSTQQAGGNDEQVYGSQIMTQQERME